MSFQITNQTLSLSLPTIPHLTTYPLSLDIPTSSLRTGMRLLIAVATYLLFRPHLEKLFRTFLGADDPASTQPSSKEELQERLKKLEVERGEPIGGGRKKVAGVVTGTGTGVQTTPAGGKARRKA